MSPLDHALHYARRGWRVIPIPPGQKYPAVTEWQLRATTDETTIRAWWTDAPDHGVGIATGPESGIFVLDIDPRHGGDDSLAELVARHGELPDTVEAITGGGGRHIFFRYPDAGGITITNNAGLLGVGLDVRGAGGQVLAAPTIHPTSGQPYTWDLEHDPLEGQAVTDAPAWLLELLTAGPANTTPRRPPAPRTLGDPMPGDRYAELHDWPDILGADGWTLHSTHTHAGDSYELWTRPGKTPREGASASLYYGGSDVLKVFTSSCPPLQAEQTYTRFGYYAATRHGGDHAAAARAIRAELGPAEPTPPITVISGSGTLDESAKTGNPGTTVELERRSIVHNGRHLDDLTRDAVNVLALANTPPRLFVRAGMPTRIRTDEDGRPIIEPLNRDHVRHRLAETAWWYKVNADGVRTATPPPDVLVANVLAGEGWPFPPLTGITEVPVLRPDGTFYTDHGYEPSRRLYHWCATAYPELADQPTADDVKAAAGVIHDVLADFPFDTIADRANAWALLVTGIVRPAITGQVPMALLDAPEPGTGKGLLAKVAAIITTGRQAAMEALPAEDAELEKRITSLLLAGATTIIFDNVEGAIRSPVLAGALTADVWRGRILGASKSVEIPSRVTWLATGNNIAVGGDLARRCYRIRLDARQAQPWRRTGFRHPDLEQHVTANRGEIIAALCTLVRSWWNAGRHVPDGLPALGGYTPWVQIVGGILHHAGVDGFLTNLEAFHESADREALGWEAFITAWHRAWGDETITAGALARRLGDQQSVLGAIAVVEALPDDLAPLWGTTRFSTRLGRALAQRAGRHYGPDGLHIVNHGLDRSKVTTYSVSMRSAGVELLTPAERESVTCDNESTRGYAGENSLLGEESDLSTYPQEERNSYIGQITPANPRTPAVDETATTQLDPLDLF